MFSLSGKELLIYDGEKFYQGIAGGYGIEQYGFGDSLKLDLEIVGFKESGKIQLDKKTMKQIAKHNNKQMLNELEKEKQRFADDVEYYKNQIKELKKRTDDQKKYLSIVSEKTENETLEGFLRHRFYGMQAFNTRNFAGDPMITVYDKDGIQVDYCEHYGYIEIFGISKKEFKELQEKEVIR